MVHCQVWSETYSETKRLNYRVGLFCRESLVNSIDPEETAFYNWEEEFKIVIIEHEHYWISIVQVTCVDELMD